MKALSLLQPWATLVAMGAKRYEVRRWQTPYRGPLLIHASARKPSRRERELYAASEYFNAFVPDMDLLPYGCLIAEVELTAIFPSAQLSACMALDPRTDWQQELAFDNYGPDRYIWKFESPRPLSHPLPMKGSLSLWEYHGSH